MHNVLLSNLIVDCLGIEGDESSLLRLGEELEKRMETPGTRASGDHATVPSLSIDLSL
jgi:hypothetical protein